VPPPSPALSPCSIGLPRHHADWRLLGAAVYRSVLLALPASARLWFSGLRDKRLLGAVEAYTARHESPALLAAEFAAIRAGVAGGCGAGACASGVCADLCLTGGQAGR
jgi:hypothetical protein